MKIPCYYCGQMISDTEQNCPYCGGANRNVKRGADNIPATIQELKDYCEAHHLPLQAMRVFIGENYQGAKAYGIYQDKSTNHFIVYKNKADGSRAIRYEGNDEAYAVNELYLKINARVAEQKNTSALKPQSQTRPPQKQLTASKYSISLFVWCLLLFLPFVFLFPILLIKTMLAAIRIQVTISMRTFTIIIITRIGTDGRIPPGQGYTTPK